MIILKGGVIPPFSVFTLFYLRLNPYPWKNN
nr:MAG TPA: hypothetical protein [Caudoviricetes sp.]